MARNKNKLLVLLENNDSAKQQFVTLVEEMGGWAFADYLRTGGFMGQAWYVSGQTIRNIMKRLGYKGIRGRKPKKPQAVANSGPTWKLK